MRYYVYSHTRLDKEEYRSIKEAWILTKVNATNISAVCMQKRPYAGGFIWKFIN